MPIKSVAALVAWAVAAGLTAQAQTPTKIGIISIQDAIVRTEEGQKTAKALTEKYSPRQSELEKKKRELDDLQAQLSKGRNTMSEEARNNLIRQIDQKNKALTRDNEDASAEYQQEEGKLINAIGQKMTNLVDKYAKENGYSIILDYSSPQSPVLYAVSSVDITSAIVALYDKTYGTGGATASGAPAPAPAPAAKPPGTSAAPVTRPPITRPPATPKTSPARPPSGAPTRP